MLILWLSLVALHSHTAHTADSYVGRLLPGYKPGNRRLNPRPKTAITKVKSGKNHVKVGGPIKTTFFVPDAAFGEHLDFAKMMENIFFGATSAIDPKALAKSAATFKAFFKALRKMSSGYKKMNGIQNIRPRIKQLKEHVKARIKHVVPIDFFELNNYDTESMASESYSETSFGGEAGSSTVREPEPEYEMTDVVKSGFKTMFKTDTNLTVSERVAAVKQKMKDLFASK